MKNVGKRGDGTAESPKIYFSVSPSVSFEFTIMFIIYFKTKTIFEKMQ